MTMEAVACSEWSSTDEHGPGTDECSVLVVPNAPTRRPTSAERLMAAVLEDAIQELQLTRRVRIDGWRSRKEMETRRWFASRDRWWPYSFENICEALGLEVTAVRRRLGIIAAA